MPDLIYDNLPILIIALPLFAAPLIALLPNNETGRSASWFFTFIISGLIFSGAFHLLVNVLGYGTLNYSLGNWPATIGIQYMATRLNCYILMVLCGINFMLVPSAQGLVEAEIPPGKISLFYSCYLLCLSGLFGMVISNDIFNIYIFLEISSLAAYALVACGKTPSAPAAAFNYLVIGTLGGIFFLFGIAFIFATAGTLNINDLSTTIAASPVSKITVAALVFMLTGLFIKAAVFPFNSWLPRVYSNAPSYISAFLASVSTKVPLFIILRIIYEVFGPKLAFAQLHLNNLLIILALTGIIYGSVAAFMQQNISRMLAFSSITNISYILLGFALNNTIALTASLFLFLSHGLAKSGFFLIAGATRIRTADYTATGFNGLAKTSPVTAACLVIFSLSLIGIPLTPGFSGKWYLITSALELQSYWQQALVIFTIIASSAVTALYTWRLIEAAYFKPAPEKSSFFLPDFSLVVISLALIIAGIAATPLLQYLQNLAQAIIGGSNG